MEPKKNFTRIIGIALAIVIGLIGVLWYVKADIDKRLLSIRQTRTDIRSKEQSVSTLASLQGDAEKAKEHLLQIDRMLTTKDQLLGFSTDIGLIARQVGFSGSPKFKEETAPPAKDMQKTNFALSLDGQRDIKDIAEFFRLVEKSNYYVRFTGLDVIHEGANLRANTEGYVISF